MDVNVIIGLIAIILGIMGIISGSSKNDRKRFAYENSLYLVGGSMAILAGVFLVIYYI